MTVHVRTDPACVEHEADTAEVGRGRTCPVCVPRYHPDPDDYCGAEYGEARTGECECSRCLDPDAGRDDVLADPDVDDDSHVEREPLLYRVGARLRREWALWSCLGWSTHHRCTHALALAGGMTR